MKIPARYYGKLRDGQTVYVCGRHIKKIAVQGESIDRLMPRRGVRFIGSLNTYTKKSCEACREQ